MFSPSSSGREIQYKLHTINTFLLHQQVILLNLQVKGPLQQPDQVSLSQTSIPGLVGSHDLVPEDGKSLRHLENVVVPRVPGPVTSQVPEDSRLTACQLYWTASEKITN